MICFDKSHIIKSEIQFYALPFMMTFFSCDGGFLFFFGWKYQNNNERFSDKLSSRKNGKQATLMLLFLLKLVVMWQIELLH